MSEARDEYYKWLRNHNRDFSEPFNYVNELESEKAELIEIMIEAYKRFKQYEMDVDVDRPYHHIAFMDNFKELLKKHGVEI